MTRKLHNEVYIDNSVLIGVAQLIQDPEVHLSAYTLMDLETFLEAFLLFDRVLSLRGQTASILQKSLDTTKLREMRGLMFEMRSAGVFSTRYAEKDTAISDLGPYRSATDTGILPPSLDLPLPLDLPPLTVDAYLERAGVYYGVGAADKHRESRLSNFRGLYERTADYLFTSLHFGRPYMATSLRIPIVQYMMARLQRHVESAVQKCVEMAEKPMRERIELTVKEFPSVTIGLHLPPLSKYILERISSPDQIPEAVAALRADPMIVRLRAWCCRFQESLEMGDVTEIDRGIKTLEGVVGATDSTGSAAVIVKSIVDLAQSPLASTIELMKSSADRVAKWLRERDVIFIKDLATTEQSVLRNRALIQRVFRRPLDAEDIAVFGELRKRGEMAEAAGASN